MSSNDNKSRLGAGRHQFLVYEFVKERFVLGGRESWVTAHDIAAHTGVNERTVRGWTERLAAFKIFDLLAIPGEAYRYQFNAFGGDLQRLEALEASREIFGDIQKIEPRGS